MVDLKHGRILGLGLLVVVLAPALAMAQTVHVPFHWTAPSTGATVEHYNIYYILDGGAPRLLATSPVATYTLEATRGHGHRIQVSGVDADGREGQWSQSSDEVFFQIPETGDPPPATAVLRPNFPNPFNPQTTIAYGVPENLVAGAQLTLDVYDLRGNRLRRFTVDDAPGWHAVIWDGADDRGAVSGSGQYVVRFRCGSVVTTWKMTMLK